jgi:hypothetical protein
VSGDASPVGTGADLPGGPGAEGVRKVHGVCWNRGLVIALIVTGVGFVVFLPFMR